MRLRQLIFTLLLNKVASAASCGSATIASQSDANIINACPTVAGDVILATNATGTINLDGIQVIQGSLASEDCSSNCTSLTVLSSSTLVSVSQNISLQGLSGLQNISLPQLQTVGAQFYLDSLPSLQNLSVPLLSSVGQFHLVAASNLVNMSLNRIENVTGPNASVEVIGIGLPYLISLSAFKTNLSSFILRDAPNLPGFDFSAPQIDYLEFGGMGSAFGVGIGAFSVGTLNMSSCHDLVFIWETNCTFDNMILRENNIAYLSLHGSRVINNLSIVDNPNLSTALLPINMSIQNIEIRGNDALESSEIIAGDGEWPWGVKNVSSMILEGSFDPLFFEVYNNWTLVEVSREFSLTSNEPNFDCSFLNSLRRQGYFQGNYTCQGTAVAAGHVRTSPGSSGSSLSTPWLSLVIGIVISSLCSAL